MPRRRTVVNAETLAILKNQVKIRSKLECKSFADMQQLQLEIKKNMNEYLSLQTLNRLYGIIKNDFNPSQHTLDLLAQYLHYNSFHDFELLNSDSGSMKQQTSFESRFLLSVFSSINPECNNDSGLKQVIRNMLDIMNKDRVLADGVYPAMASIPFGRKYFFEQFINMDGLAKEYGDGLKYYLLYAGSREQQFFAYNLYCLRYFLAANENLFRRSLELINDFSRDEISSFRPELIGHYLATLALRHSLEKKPGVAGFTEPNVDLIPLSGNNKSIYQARYLVAEALVLTGEFEKAWEWLKQRMQSFSIATSDDEYFVTQLSILRLLSGYYSGNINGQKAQLFFSELNGKSLDSLVQDYFSILLLLLKMSLFPKAMTRKETDANVEQLIIKTGFVYFREYKKQLQKVNESF